MQLHEQIERKKEVLSQKTHRSLRKRVHREHVLLMVKQLRKEIRQDRRKS